MATEPTPPSEMLTCRRCELYFHPDIAPHRQHCPSCRAPLQETQAQHPFPIPGRQ